MRGAHPERKVERALKHSGIIRGGERVLVACSGGPDSVALAAALHAVARSLKLVVSAAFINHGTRGSAWQDECVALHVAARFEMPIDIAAVDGAGYDEQRLRVARYDALIDIASRRGCAVVATGHHAEDQTETVLLALLRGSGPRGLTGMRARRPLTPSIDLARPFLQVSSESLRAYCHALALPYAVDPSNAQTSLRRNAVREALAALRSVFPALDAAVARTAEVVSEERNASKRAKLRRVVRTKVAGEADLRGIDFVHVEEVVRALEQGRTGTFYMKPGITLRVDRDCVVVLRESATGAR